MRTPLRITMLAMALAVGIHANAIDIKLKKDKTVVDGISYTLNPTKLWLMR